MSEPAGQEGPANLLWWQRVGSGWREEVERRKGHRLTYYVQEVFVAEYFARLAPARVLEFGCGFGRHLRYLESIEQLDVHGYDQSESLVAGMQAWASPEWIREHVRVGAPLAPLPYPDRRFDAVFTVSVLIHNRPENLDQILSELVRVCRGHLLLVENVHVTETSLSSPEHDGCWLHPLEAHFARLGLSCERLPRCLLEHDVYRVRVDPSARVANIHPVTLGHLHAMQERIAAVLDVPEGKLAARLAEMTADRDRLWEETKQRYREYEQSREALAATATELATVQGHLGAMAADRDRLWAEVRAWEAEAGRLGQRAAWLETELGRVVRSRSFRMAQRLAGAPPARLARRVFLAVKDRVSRDLHVRATSERNPASNGSEVWVVDVGACGAAVRCDGHWTMSELPGGGSTWRADGQGTLVITPGRHRPRLRLRAYPAGGIAEVRYLGRPLRVDCYRARETVVEIDPAAGRVSEVEMPTVSPSAGGAPVPAWQESLERFRASGQEHLAICPPDWFGVGTAMRIMFRQVVPVPELRDAMSVEAYAGILLESGAKKIVLGGFARGYEELVLLLNKRRPAVRIYAAWCGNPAQHNEDYTRWSFNTLHALATQGFITCVGHTKVGLERSLRDCGYPVRTLLLWYPPDPSPSARPIADGFIHLGLFTAGSGWRKNVHNQITAAGLIERHALHMKVTYAHELDWARIVKVNLVEVFENHIPDGTFRELLAHMHCNLYVSFSENGPLLPLESLGLGAVSLIGPAGHLFRDHPYLRERLIVPYPDDPVVIAEYALRAIAERETILDAYTDFCRDYLPAAERSVADFLAVE